MASLPGRRSKQAARARAKGLASPALCQGQQQERTPGSSHAVSCRAIGSSSATDALAAAPGERSCGGAREWPWQDDKSNPPDHA